MQTKLDKVVRLHETRGVTNVHTHCIRVLYFREANRYSLSASPLLHTWEMFCTDTRHKATHFFPQTIETDVSDKQRSSVGVGSVMSLVFPYSTVPLGKSSWTHLLLLWDFHRKQCVMRCLFMLVCSLQAGISPHCLVFYYEKNLLCNSLNAGGNYLYHLIQQLINFLICFYVFRVILSVNSDYFLKQRQPVDLCNGEVLCFLCGTDWILKCYLESFSFKGLIVIKVVLLSSFSSNWDCSRWLQIFWREISLSTERVLLSLLHWLEKHRREQLELHATNQH
jgi:hypothetical protein